MFSSASGRERSNSVTVLFGIAHNEGDGYSNKSTHGGDIKLLVILTAE